MFVTSNFYMMAQAQITMFFNLPNQVETEAVSFTQELEDRINMSMNDFEAIKGKFVASVTLKSTSNSVKTGMMPRNCNYWVEVNYDFFANLTLCLNYFREKENISHAIQIARYVSQLVQSWEIVKKKWILVKVNDDGNESLIIAPKPIHEQTTHPITIQPAMKEIAKFMVRDIVDNYWVSADEIDWYEKNPNRLYCKKMKQRHICAVTKSDVYIQELAQFCHISKYFSIACTPLHVHFFYTFSLYRFANLMQHNLDQAEPARFNALEINETFVEIWENDQKTPQFVIIDVTIETVLLKVATHQLLLPIRNFPGKIIYMHVYPFTESLKQDEDKEDEDDEDDEDEDEDENEDEDEDENEEDEQQDQKMNENEDNLIPNIKQMTTNIGRLYNMLLREHNVHLLADRQVGLCESSFYANRVHTEVRAQIVNQNAGPFSSQQHRSRIAREVDAQIDLLHGSFLFSNRLHPKWIEVLRVSIIEVLCDVFHGLKLPYRKSYTPDPKKPWQSVFDNKHIIFKGQFFFFFFFFFRMQACLPTFFLNFEKMKKMKKFPECKRAVQLFF